MEAHTAFSTIRATYMDKLPIGTNETKLLITALRKIDFFRDLTVSDLDHVLARVSLHEYPAEIFLFKQGDKPDGLYIVYEGLVKVTIKRWFFLPPKTIKVLDAGEFVGEMALVDGSPRSASIQTMTPSKIFVLLRSHVDQIIEQNPSFRKKMMAVAEERKLSNKALV